MVSMSNFADAAIRFRVLKRCYTVHRGTLDDVDVILENGIGTST